MIQNVGEVAKTPQPLDPEIVRGVQLEATFSDQAVIAALERVQFAFDDLRSNQDKLQKSEAGHCIAYLYPLNEHTNLGHFDRYAIDLARGQNHGMETREVTRDLTKKNTRLELLWSGYDQNLGREFALYRLAATIMLDNAMYAPGAIWTLKSAQGEPT